MATQPHLDFRTGVYRPARFTLRDASRGEHDRVDAVFSAFDLQTLTGYGDFLSAHYAAHREAESWLAMADIPAGFRLADRTGLIAADLGELGRAVPAQVLPQPVPAQHSFAAAAGILYCLSGSSFGARVLIQRLWPDAPRRFLAEPLPAGYWQRLVGALDRIEQAGQLPATLAAARRTFALFAASAKRSAVSPGPL
ncbi:biliverdin-producing heme oxygenase [Novosphingobium sp.]|uniref:biliverdin-producing heme oxygenase n=1 Tax=Novosphingobium sp. TaxID=1874826 RepID=UPI0025EA7E2F|nr:biliverdin-producing heme oxygenase [Novosphingobium sp.]